MTIRLVLLTLTLASTLVQAQVCDPRSSLSQITREYLLRASKDGDLPTAQDLPRALDLPHCQVTLPVTH